ncbi:RDD family protein [Vibrio europaeus]|nr:RDD family protein [Vibrio europaeus]
MIGGLELSSEVVLASRWSRFGATSIDVIISMAFNIPIILYTDIGARLISLQALSITDVLLSAIYSMIAYILCHGYLLHKKGQTIGKYVFGISIVNMKGELIGFPKIYLKRNLPVGMAAYIPFIGGYLPLADMLFIFRKDKRCMHDLIAGTQVVSVAVKKDTDFN